MMKKMMSMKVGEGRKLVFYLLAIIAMSATSFNLCAEDLDKLPPIPYAQAPLIFSATHKLPEREFLLALAGGDISTKKDEMFGNEKLSFAVLKRGGNAGLKLTEDSRIAECTLNNMDAMDKEQRSYCDDVQGVIKTIQVHEYSRAVFSSMGFSFDKSMVEFANDCNTYGNCDKAVKRLADISKNIQSLEMISLYVGLCKMASAVKSNEQKELFLSKEIIDACPPVLRILP